MVENEDSKPLMDAELYQMIRAKETTEILSSFGSNKLFGFIAHTRGLENNNVFHVAAQCGNGDFIKLALDHQFPDGNHGCIYDLLYEQNFKGEIPLHLAAQSGDKKTVETLLALHDSSSLGDHDNQKNRYLCIIDKHGDTPLHRALRYGQQDIAILLLQRDFNLAYLPDNEAGESLAYLAAQNLCERFLHTILDSQDNEQSSISFSAPFGMTVFHAARNLNDDIMLALIDRRRELLKHRDNIGKTVLHYAVEDAIEPMVNVLLKADSSLAFLHDDDGMTPLHRASSMGSFSIVRTILELSPHSISTICDKGDHAGQTPPHVAKMDTCFLRVCLRHTSMKDLVNVMDKEGNTPLHLALKQNSLAQDIANVLLEVSGINWRLKNNEGYTPMDLCKSTNLVVSKENNGDVVENISKSKDNIPSNLKILTSDYWRVKEDIHLQLLDIELSPEYFEMVDRFWEDRFTSYRGFEGYSAVHLAAREGDMGIIDKAVEWDNKSRVLLLSGENSKAETPLHVAAAAGKLEIVEAILKLSISTDKFGNKKPEEEEEQVAVVIETSNANDDHNRTEMNSNAEWKPWKMKSAKGDTPLHSALRNGYEEVAMCLLKWDPSLLYSSVNKMNQSLLYLAALSRCSNVVHHLLTKSNTRWILNQADRYLDAGGPHGQNALHAAMRRPRETTTREELSNAPSFNFDTPDVSYPNQLAGINDNDAADNLILHMPQLLIRADNNGKTPMHYAAELGNFKGWFYQSLKANYTLASLMYDNEGFTPLLRVVANGSLNVGYDILDSCEDSMELRHAGNEGTMLHLLKVTSADAVEEWVKIMEKFPKMKRLINETDKDGNTPLHCAVLKSDITKIRLLLSINGVRLFIQNKRHQTPMDLCTQLRANGDSRHLAIWIALEDFVAKEEKRRSQVPLLLRMNTSVMMSYGGQGMSSEEDLKKLLENVAVVAALLITLTFAATFTIPGGYDGDTGQALLMKKASVKAFVASNVVAMLLGVGVLLTYTFGATKKAWLRVLSIPCVVMLQCALLATIVAFISGVYALVFKDAKWIATLAVGIVGAVLFLFSITPAGAGAAIQSLKWFKTGLKWLLIKVSEKLVVTLCIIPYLLAERFRGPPHFPPNGRYCVR